MKLHASRQMVGARQGGMALVMVLCALFVLSLVIFGLARRVQEETFVTGRDSRGLDASALAFTGVQIALHPLTTAKTPALSRQTNPGHRYEARLLGEGGKINLNWLLAGEDPVKIEFFKTYLENKGLSYQERDQLADCMLDWVNPGNLQHIHGSRKAVDGQAVPGRPFQSVAELARVVGSQPLTRQPGWDRDFTLLSQGPIDLQWASEEIVGALPGVGMTRALNFVKVRRGKDGIDGTPDDLMLSGDNSRPPGMPNPVLGNSVDPGVLIPQLLGLSPTAYQGIVSNLVTLNDPTVRIVCVGQAYDVKRTVEVVARKQSIQPQILSWKEY